MDNKIVYTYEIRGAVPSKKNSRRLFRRGKRVFNLPSKYYEKWHKDALEQLALQKRPPSPIKRCAIDILLEYDNIRRRDIDNATNSIFDLLVDAGIIIDDNINCVHKMTVEGMYCCLSLAIVRVYQEG